MNWKEFDEWLQTCPNITSKEISVEGALESYGIDCVKLRNADHSACVVQMSFLISGIPAEKEEEATSHLFNEIEDAKEEDAKEKSNG